MRSRGALASLTCALRLRANMQQLGMDTVSLSIPCKRRGERNAATTTTRQAVPSADGLLAKRPGHLVEPRAVQ